MLDLDLVSDSLLVPDIHMGGLGLPPHAKGGQISDLSVDLSLDQDRSLKEPKGNPHFPELPVLDVVLRLCLAFFRHPLSSLFRVGGRNL